jgi:tetratricopeptide (TPR) repeat protein
MRNLSYISHYDDKSTTMAQVLDNQGIAYKEKGLNYKKSGELDEAYKYFNQALESYKKALEIRKDDPDKRNVAVIQMNIAVVNKHLGEFGKGIDYLQKAKEGFDSHEGKINFRSFECLGNIAELYIEWENYPKAYRNLVQATEILKALWGSDELKCRKYLKQLVLESTSDLLKKISFDSHHEVLEQFESLKKDEKRIPTELLDFLESLKSIIAKDEAPKQLLVSTGIGATACAEGSSVGGGSMRERDDPGMMDVIETAGHCSNKVMNDAGEVTANSALAAYASSNTSGVLEASSVGVGFKKVDRLSIVGSTTAIATLAPDAGAEDAARESIEAKVLIDKGIAAEVLEGTNDKSKW